MDRETADTLLKVAESIKSQNDVSAATVKQTGLLCDATERLLKLYNMQADTVKRQAVEIRNLKSEVSGLSLALLVLIVGLFIMNLVTK